MVGGPSCIAPGFIIGIAHIPRDALPRTIYPMKSSLAQAFNCCHRPTAVRRCESDSELLTPRPTRPDLHSKLATRAGAACQSTGSGPLVP
jgi:hypothetical protein